MDGTLAEIRWFAGNFAPRSWMFCNGQLLSIAQWTAVFALVGTTYGGNGQTTFGLPDFRGRMAVGFGSGPGLSNIDLGELGGSPSVTLLVNNLPPHNHPVTGTVTQQANNDNSGLNSDPTNKRLGSSGNIFTSSVSEQVNMAASAVSLQTGLTGSNLPVSVMPPYTGMNFIFCVEGIFPSRN